MKWCSRGSFSQSAGAVKWFGEPVTLRTSLDGKVWGRHNGAVMSVATAVDAFILLVGIIAANMLVKLNININLKE